MNEKDSVPQKARRSATNERRERLEERRRDTARLDEMPTVTFRIPRV